MAWPLFFFRIRLDLLCMVCFISCSIVPDAHIFVPKYVIMVNVPKFCEH